MAIEKTVFTGTTQAANASEVYAFLNANKSGYFDSVVMDETNNNITCYAAETPALKLGFDGTEKSIKVTLANGVTSGSYPSNLMWLCGVKTSKGLCLHGSTSDVFITKTNGGTLAVLFKAQTTSTASNMDFVGADIMNGTGGYKAVTDFSSTTKVFHTAGVTVFSPVPLSASVESYAPNVYVTAYGQYIGTEGKLTANGKEYYYTGYIALAD